jgi:uncharacterized cofD-like protein
MANKNSLKLTCIGGGTGLSRLLLGIKQYSQAQPEGIEIIDMNKFTAVVAMSDDGGSSGKLIDEFGGLPPGDIRNCLTALADDKSMSRLFAYRFENDSAGSGHSMGNLLLYVLDRQNKNDNDNISLSKIISDSEKILNDNGKIPSRTQNLLLHLLNQLNKNSNGNSNGSFLKAISDASKILGVTGRVLPVTLDETVLCAELTNGDVVRGESLIPKRKNRQPIQRVYLSKRTNGSTAETYQPEFVCEALPEAIMAIDNADAIIIGPGSLYTSVIPNLLAKDVTVAINRSRAKKIYVCNIAIESGETDNYTVSDHVRAILNHADFKLDYVLANSGLVSFDNTNQVIFDPQEDFLGEITLREEDMICVETVGNKTFLRHEPFKLAAAIMRILSDDANSRSWGNASVLAAPSIEAHSNCCNCRFWERKDQALGVCWPLSNFYPPTPVFKYQKDGCNRWEKKSKLIGKRFQR